MHATSLEFLPAVTESQIFADLQWRRMRNRVLDLWQSNRLRFLVVAILSVVFWCIVFWLFIDGFGLMNSTIAHEGTRTRTVHTIFNVFFLSLFVMVAISSTVIFFGIAFRGRDIPTLLVLPVRPRRVALLKLEEALLFGGWGFFLLGSPMLWAYGITAGAPWYFFLAVIPFMVAFVAIPVAMGALACLVAIRYISRFRVQALVLVLCMLSLAVAGLTWSIVREARVKTVFSVEWLDGTLTRLRFSEQPLLPSWWLSSGLLEAAHPAVTEGRQSWRESLGFFSLLASHGLVLYLLTGWVADRCYLSGFSEMVELGRPRTRIRSGRLERFLYSALWPVPPTVRILLAKDLRIFLRDILQWSQFAVFSGLLAIYFLNIRRLQTGAQFVGWVVIIGYLNIGVVGLLWATFTTRFVYPLLSLEGRRLWVLGTAPIDPKMVLWSKFLFAVALGLLPCSLLVLMSDIMLGIGDLGQWIVVLHQITTVSLNLGLAGIAVGLGAWLPNLQESSPAKIATGFGGTLTLVMSVVYIVLTVLATAVPVWSWSQSGIEFRPMFSAHGAIQWMGSGWGLLVGLILTMILSGLALWLPLWLGLRAFRELDK